jgi:hypothetical protein
MYSESALFLLRLSVFDRTVKMLIVFKFFLEGDWGKITGGGFVVAGLWLFLDRGEMVW